MRSACVSRWFSVVFVGAVACGGGDEPSGESASAVTAPEFGTLEATLTHATGIFAAGAERTVFAGYGAEVGQIVNAGMGHVSAASASSVNVHHLQSVHPLAGAPLG